ncbi:MAG TPA: type II secretion system F family protein [Candidatus Sulfotelmatobacter sp.]|jgi:type II secretory pathway component PulF|nr:type II secretion system F family protein [Candidatus Sulfotelmatobacter sp.]
MEFILTSLFGALLGIAIILVPGIAFSFLVHYLLSMPMNRRDRARFFLDLMETALNRGQAMEQAILSAAESRDRVMGVRFYMLAAYIEDGARLGEGLEKVPAFLPPQVNAMLRAGEKLGDLKKVLPACREVLRVATDTVRNTTHYMVVILLVFAPICIWLITLMMVFVVPRFRDVARGMGVTPWPVSRFLFSIVPQLIGFEIAVFVILTGMAALYIGGPSFVRWFQFRSVPVVDWIAWHVPWKRKKLLRAFSAMLAVLLDGGVPEGEAVRLAGESTANEICRRRARRVIAALERGEKLDDAVRVFDDTGEFHWRLANAVHSRSGFLDALRGWHAALDAKAFQQEETATHMMTSGLVIMNGLVVGLIAVGMFGLLIMILKGVLNAT